MSDVPGLGWIRNEPSRGGRVRRPCPCWLFSPEPEWKQVTADGPPAANTPPGRLKRDRPHALQHGPKPSGWAYSEGAGRAGSSG